MNCPNIIIEWNNIIEKNESNKKIFYSADEYVVQYLLKFSKEDEIYENENNEKKKKY